MGLIHDGLTESKGKVVRTDQGWEARIPYRTACRDYALGFALPFFMAAVVAGFVSVAGDFVPEVAVHLSVRVMGLFGAVGFALVIVGYVAPVWFYELMEERPEV